MPDQVLAAAGFGAEPDLLAGDEPEELEEPDEPEELDPEPSVDFGLDVDDPFEDADSVDELSFDFDSPEEPEAVSFDPVEPTAALFSLRLSVR